MSANRWFATGNFFATYREEQRIFSTHLDRTVLNGCIYFFSVSGQHRQNFIKLLSLRISNRNTG